MPNKPLILFYFEAFSHYKYYCVNLYSDESGPILPPEIWTMVLKKLTKFADIANAVIIEQGRYHLYEDTPKFYMQLYVKVKIIVIHYSQEHTHRKLNVTQPNDKSSKKQVKSIFASSNSLY